MHAAAQAVACGTCELGIILGGSGNEAIVANRLRDIRCAVVWNERTAQLSKEHGNCNMIGIGQRMMTQDQALSIVDAWLNADFKGGRHQLRIDQIDGQYE
ncbi:MAG: ribose 5-phosphate isomerase B [Enterobacterales bacterium]